MLEKLSPYILTVILIAAGGGVGLAISTEQYTGFLGLWQWLGVAVIWSCIIGAVITGISCFVGWLRGS